MKKINVLTWYSSPCWGQCSYNVMFIQIMTAAWRNPGSYLVSAQNIYTAVL